MKFSDTMQNNEVYSPIFVVGPPRSGTTVLSRAMGLSTKVILLEETFFLELILARRHPFLVSQMLPKEHPHPPNPWTLLLFHLADRLRFKDRLAEFLFYALRSVRLDDYSLKRTRHSLVDTHSVSLQDTDLELMNRLTKKHTRLLQSQPETALGVLMKDVLVSAGKQAIVEKSPLHFRYIPAILRLFPDSRIIYTRRHARDIMTSYVLSFSQRHLTISAAVDSIAKDCLDAEKTAKLYQNDERIRFVNYSDFMKNPLTILTTVYDFTGLQKPTDLPEKTRVITPKPSRWNELSPKQQTMIQRHIT